jgi:hypothetical protein
MLGTTADNDLIDRITIEIGLDARLGEQLRAIEHVISVPRDRWHPKIAATLDQQDQQGAEAL